MISLVGLGIREVQFESVISGMGLIPNSLVP